MNVASPNNPDPHLNGGGKPQKKPKSKSKAALTKDLGGAIAAAKKKLRKKKPRPTASRARVTASARAPAKKTAVEAYWELQSKTYLRHDFERFLCGDYELSPAARKAALRILNELERFETALSDLQEAVTGNRRHGR